MMEEVTSSETSVFTRTTRHNSPGDSILNCLNVGINLEQMAGHVSHRSYVGLRSIYLDAKLLVWSGIRLCRFGPKVARVFVPGKGGPKQQLPCIISGSEFTGGPATSQPQFVFVPRDVKLALGLHRPRSYCRGSTSGDVCRLQSAARAALLALTRILLSVAQSVEALC
jgi:hypothetical protein